MHLPAVTLPDLFLSLSLSLFVCGCAFFIRFPFNLPNEACHLVQLVTTSFVALFYVIIQLNSLRFILIGAHTHTHGSFIEANLDEMGFLSRQVMHLNRCQLECWTRKREGESESDSQIAQSLFLTSIKNSWMVKLDYDTWVSVCWLCSQ